MKQTFITDVTQRLVIREQMNIDIRIKHKQNSEFNYNKSFQKTNVNIK